MAGHAHGLQTCALLLSAWHQSDSDSSVQEAIKWIDGGPPLMRIDSYKIPDQISSWWASWSDTREERHNEIMTAVNFIGPKTNRELLCDLELLDNAARNQNLGHFVLHLPNEVNDHWREREGRVTKLMVLISSPKFDVIPLFLCRDSNILRFCRIPSNAMHCSSTLWYDMIRYTDPSVRKKCPPLTG